MIEIGKIWTEGCIQLSAINDLSIKQTLNSHGMAMVTAYVDNDAVVQKVNESDGIEIWGKDDNGSVLLFCGHVKNCRLTSLGTELYELQLSLISYSADLDREKKRRSFQDISQTYADIAKQVAGESAFVWCNAGNDTKPYAPVIQYDETDWEFLIRIASHIKETIAGDIHVQNCQIDFGSGKKIKQLQDNYKIIENGVSAQFYQHKGGSQSDFIYDVIECEENLALGSGISVNDQKRYVFEKNFYIIENCLKRTYHIGSEVFLHHDMIYNQNFTGRVIQGEVLETANETLKIKMEIDDRQDKNRAFWYDWKPETGNLMYCMPQVGTKVSLYFPDEDERNGYIINCIRTNGSSCQDMNDPDNKTFTSEHGKRMMMNGEQLSFIADHSNENSASVILQDESGVIINSDKKVQIIASAMITVESENAIIEAAIEISCQQGEEANGLSTTTLTLNARIDIVSNQFRTDMRTVFFYPDIMDTIEIVERDSLLGKILLGVACAVGAALIGAVFITCGAAILATAGIASAAIASAGYASIFATAFVSGSLAGTFAVGATAVEDAMTGNTKEYGEYMAVGGANGFASAITGGIAAPINEAIEAAKIGKAAYFAYKFGLGSADSVGSYLASQAMLGGDIDGLDLTINAITGGIFNMNGARIDEMIDNEKLWGEILEGAYKKAYAKDAEVREFKMYYELLANNPSFFNGSISPQAFAKLNDLMNPGLVKSNIESNAIKNARSTMNAVNNDKGLTEDQKMSVFQAYVQDVLDRPDDENQYYIVRGAVLKCTHGSHKRRFDINSDYGVRSLSSDYPHPYIGGAQCIVGETDNIKFFGICKNCTEGEDICVKTEDGEDKITGIKCEPDLLGSAWFDTKDNSLIASEKLVTGKSFLMCKNGGCITVVTSGEEYCGELDDGEISSQSQNN